MIRRGENLKITARVQSKNRPSNWKDLNSAGIDRGMNRLRFF